MLLKALWPRRQVLGASGKADLAFFFFNTFSAGGLIGWGLLSQSAVSAWTAGALVRAFGPAGLHVNAGAAAVTTTLVMFVAYDLAYWVDHWLSHHVPCLWEIHKVHHTAEALSPLTNFRVYPLESLKFYNIAVLATGAADGALAYAFGAKHGRVMLFNADVIVLAFMFTFAHLQHSHVWISFRGTLGRVILSPAHHQIHHSADPQHFGLNLGNALAVWDWMFGSLYVPAARREPLRFGVEGQTAAAHGVTGSLITPMVDAGSSVAAAVGRVVGRAQARRS